MAGGAMIADLIARLRAHYEAMLGPDYLQAADALEAQEANAKQLADTIRDMHAAGLELRQRAEQAERALADAVKIIDQLSSFRVGTTLAAVVSPLTSAEAIITDAGWQALSPSPQEAT
jgi:hypothetical protein